jgi:hypothetical protein
MPGLAESLLRPSDRADRDLLNMTYSIIREARFVKSSLGLKTSVGVKDPFISVQVTGTFTLRVCGISQAKTLRVSFPSGHTHLKCKSQAICPSADQALDL